MRKEWEIKYGRSKLSIQIPSGVGSGKWEVGSGKWEVGSGKWEVGSGKWEVGSGKWEVGSGKWEVGSGKGFANVFEGGLDRPNFTSSIIFPKNCHRQYEQLLSITFN